MAKKTQDTLKADLVVIGGGGSGLTAAAAALESGIKNIIILEKRAKVGGNAVNPAGLLAVNTPLQRQLGMDASTDVAFKHAVTYGHWKNNPRLLRVLIDKSADTIQWLESKGIIFNEIITHYPNQFPNTYHVARGSDGTGQQIINALNNQCLKARVKFLLNTKAKKILLDNKNRVAGILAEESDGKEMEITAPCMVICTGGFSGNEKLIQKYDPTYRKKLVPPRGLPNDGDGIKMATEVGADLDGMVVYEWEAFCTSSVFLTVLLRRPGTMWVNRKGERYCDEGIMVAVEAANAISRQPGKESFTIFDETLKSSMLKDKLTPFEAFFIKGEARDRKWSNFADTALEDLENGVTYDDVKISKSLAELANWIGAKPEALKAEVAEYNKFCEHGRDADFAKDSKHLLPLKNPPYYALRGGIKLTMTHGGIKVNQRMEVVDKEDNPITGLYAAGVETGAKDWDSYNMWLSGHSFGYTINGGRIAGEEAAKFLLNR
jgi:fumarate reductase flavoprotein subunit